MTRAVATDGAGSVADASADVFEFSRRRIGTRDGDVEVDQVRVAQAASFL